MAKTKIVWLCHFTNAEIQSLLPLWINTNEFASWIPNLVEGIENRDDFEIHIVSPHDYLMKSVNFTLRGIHYHFIAYGIPVWHRHWPNFFTFDALTNYFFLRKKIKKVINNIKPELINLFGAENAYYSSVILDFKVNYPVLVIIQGFISQIGSAVKLTPEIRKNIAIEERILKTFRYFAGEQDSSTYISGYNINHIFFRMYFPVNEDLLKFCIDNGKIYDCIYFGKLSKLKGIEDFIKIIAELKKSRSDIKACVVGGGNLTSIILLAKELNCYENIKFTGFIKTQKELFEYVKASRVFLVPSYFERLSSTIREAMLLKTPIVAYATGGIPYINEVDENIFLVRTGDYPDMIRKTLILLEDESLRSNLIEKAYKFAVREFSISTNVERVFSAYRTIIENVKKN